MKKLLAVLLTILPMTASAAFDNPGNRALAQEIVKSYGYRCDTVTMILYSTWNGNITVACNNNRYNYVLKDVGGNWRVEVK